METQRQSLYHQMPNPPGLSSREAADRLKRDGPNEFATLVLGNIVLIWANRSRTRTIPEMLHSRNYPVMGITAGALLLLGAVLYIPPVRDMFQFAWIGASDLALCVLLALIGVTWVETLKLWRRAAQ